MIPVRPVSYHVRRTTVHERLMDHAESSCLVRASFGSPVSRFEKIDRAFFDLTLEDRTVEAMARSIERTMRIDLHYSRIDPTRLMESLMEEESFAPKDELIGSFVLVVAVLGFAWLVWGWLT